MGRTLWDSEIAQLVYKSLWGNGIVQWVEHYRIVG